MEVALELDNGQSVEEFLGTRQENIDGFKVIDRYKDFKGSSGKASEIKVRRAAEKASVALQNTCIMNRMLQKCECQRCFRSSLEQNLRTCYWKLKER